MQTNDVYLTTDEHGETARALCCPNPALHLDRLGLTAGLLAEVRPAFLLDIGCGFGDLHTVLGRAPRYIGIDVTARFIEVAKSRGAKDAVFHHIPALDFLMLCPDDIYDAVVALGVLATQTQDDLAALLPEMKRAARKAVVVSWIQRGEYDGSFNAWDQSDLAAYLGQPVRTVSLAGDAEYTGLFTP